jgi:hypothetical protein
MDLLVSASPWGPAAFNGEGITRQGVDEVCSSLDM